MLRINTDNVEQISMELGKAVSLQEEIWYCFRQLQSEMSEDLQFMAFEEAEQILDCIYQSKRQSLRQMDILKDLSRILAEYINAYEEWNSAALAMQEGLREYKGKDDGTEEFG